MKQGQLFYFEGHLGAVIAYAGGLIRGWMFEGPRSEVIVHPAQVEAA